MIGRGTRNNAVCKHKEWLPNGKKEFFLIFDFWKNMSYFDMHPEGRESKAGEALTSKIFLIRLQLYDLFLKNKNTHSIKYISFCIILFFLCAGC